MLTSKSMAYPDLRHPFGSSQIHPDGSSSVLYQGKLTTLARTGDKLLVSADELEQITGFEVKPEGACLGSLCIPLGDKQLVEEAGQQLIDLAAFADLIGQPYVVDEETNVWSFAEAPAKREGLMQDANLMCPCGNKSMKKSMIPTSS